MADSKHMNKDLTICGICLLVIEEPKALPCLHSFCLKCLSKWAEGMKGKVRCPICVQDFIIPSEGVKGFTTNFFINTLKDRRETAKRLQAKDAVIPCLCCGESDHKAVSYCSDCGGFICEECGRAHERVRALKNHKTVPIEDLLTGKIDIRNLSDKKYCNEHEGQVLRFYCKACGVLICHECTILDHPVSSHQLVKLENITKEQKAELEKLMKACSVVKQKVEKAIEETVDSYKRSEENVSKVKEDIHKTAEEFITSIKQMVQDLEEEIASHASSNKKQVDSQKDKLQLQQTRLDTALQIATEVTETGSEYDLALAYSSLENNLSQLKDMELEVKPVDEFKFCAGDTCNIESLGSISVVSKNSGDRRRCGVGTWKAVKQFAQSGNGTIEDGRGIAVIPSTGNIVVAGFEQKVMKIYDNEGEYVSQQYYTSKPYNVATSQEGFIFLACLSFPRINVYQRDGTFRYNFVTKSPDDTLSDAQKTSHGGLAIDNQGHILVGELNCNYISNHQLNGRHICSFATSITPYFIAVAPSGNILFTDHGTTQAIHVVDKTGNFLHKIEPPCVKWAPKGICCTDVVYVANCVSRGGVYCFSVSGKYLGCISSGLKNPSGVALTEDAEKLLVVANDGVRIFMRQ